MRHVGGSKHTLTPPTYFQGVKTPNPQDLRPCTVGLLLLHTRAAHCSVFMDGSIGFGIA